MAFRDLQRALISSHTEGRRGRFLALPNLPSDAPPAGVRRIEIHRATESGVSGPCPDDLAVEEPLEIQIGFTQGIRQVSTVAVTMRTPGQDRELAVGFLYSEGIVREASDVAAVFAHGNIVRVETARDAGINWARLERSGYVSSSCGVCGKTNMGSLNEPPPRVADGGSVPARLISELPALLRARQSVFDSTGGLHASALFGFDGVFLNVAEDVGRHNALDKLIGAEFLNGSLPLSERVLLLSGRASYELIHKAAAARIPIVASVGAPSSLAVQVAEDAGITLAGFVRGGGFNIYCGEERIE